MQLHSKKDFQDLGGLANYYIWSIIHFADQTTPLTALLQKGQPRLIRWTRVTVSAFNDLYTILSMEPVLHTAQPGNPFILLRGVSDKSIGTVLSQNMPEGETPVQYLSWQLNLAEQKYATLRKKCSW